MPVTWPPISPLLYRHNKALIVWGRNERERGEESCTLLTLQWFDPLHLLLLHCTPISLLGLLLKRDKGKGWIKDRPEITTHSIHNSALSTRTHARMHAYMHGRNAPKAQIRVCYLETDEICPLITSSLLSLLQYISTG